MTCTHCTVHSLMNCTGVRTDQAFEAAILWLFCHVPRRQARDVRQSSCHQHACMRLHIITSDAINRMHETQTQPRWLFINILTLSHGDTQKQCSIQQTPKILSNTAASSPTSSTLFCFTLSQLQSTDATNCKKFSRLTDMCKHNWSFRSATCQSVLL